MGTVCFLGAWCSHAVELHPFTRLQCARCRRLPQRYPGLAQVGTCVVDEHGEPDILRHPWCTRHSDVRASGRYKKSSLERNIFFRIRETRTARIRCERESQQARSISGAIDAQSAYQDFSMGCFPVLRGHLSVSYAPRSSRRAIIGAMMMDCWTCASASSARAPGCGTSCGGGT